MLSNIHKRKAKQLGRAPMLKATQCEQVYPVNLTHMRQASSQEANVVRFAQAGSNANNELGRAPMMFTTKSSYRQA